MESLFHVAVLAFEVLGTIAMLAGVPIAAVLAIVHWRRERSALAGFQTARRALGLGILLGLELLVAADIVKTLIAPGFEDVAVLGIIVLIRTVLSFSLQIEIEGVLPWRRALLTTAPQLIARAVGAGAATAAQRGGAESD